MRQSRFSMESMLDAPDTSSARPGLRLRIAGLVVVGLFALLGLRLWALTVLQAPAAAQAVAVNQVRSVPVAPTRGLILDRSGNPLVSNLVVEQITLSRAAALNHPEVVGRLAALIGETTQQVQATIADPRYSPYLPVPVLTNAPKADILYISEHQDDFPGVSSVQTTERTYPQGELPGPAQDDYPASQTLGYVSTINATELQSEASKGYQAGDAYGQSGLEYQYESELRGTPGSQEIEVTPSGQVAGTVRTTPAVAGDNLITNLDTNLQQVADNALASQILQLRKTYDRQCDNNTGCYPAATGGAVIVMNPQTGAVYAMSSYPSYNLSEWVGGLSAAQNEELFGPNNGEPSLNRAIEGQYIPGSTFKLNTATAALNTGLITPTTPYYDTGTFKTPDCQYNSTTCIFHNSVGDPTGTYDVTSALTVSSDDFFYNLGYLFYAHTAQYGQTPIQDTAAEYSLGQLTGIGPGPGGQPGRAGQAPRRGPQGLPQHRVVHR
jgi:penicillin-binding protein 2